jgi:hypothetical protein
LCLTPLIEHLDPFLKSIDFILAVRHQGFDDMFNGFCAILLMAIAVFGEKFVGIAYDLLFD